MQLYIYIIRVKHKQQSTIDSITENEVSISNDSDQMGIVLKRSHGNYFLGGWLYFADFVYFDYRFLCSCGITCAYVDIALSVEIQFSGVISSLTFPFAVFTTRIVRCCSISFMLMYDVNGCDYVITVFFLLLQLLFRVCYVDVVIANYFLLRVHGYLAHWKKFNIMK